MERQYDLIVIGGGPGGYVAAIRGAQQGMKTALVEKSLLGGTCLNRGCIPTKTLLHASGLYKAVEEGALFGILTQGVSYDLEKMHQRKDTVVSELRQGVASLLAGNGVDCYEGHGTITAPGEVRVQGAEESWNLTCGRILIAVGAVPGVPPIPGVNLPGVITSDALLEGTPRDFKRLIIVGGGVIGVETASIYNNLGCEVVIIEAEDRILPFLDREIAQNMTMILKKRGVTIHGGSRVEEIREKDGGLALRFSHKKGEEEVQGDGVLLSMGRRANLAGLFAEGLKPEGAKGLGVNESFETSIPGIFAIGDCVEGSIQLAHVASAQATNAISIMAGHEAEMDLSLVPSCIYTEPEIASVGLTEGEAKTQGIPVKSSKYLMSGNGKSLIENQERGFVKLLFHAETEALLGAQLMCGRATDLVGGLAMAISKGATATELSRVIYPHPTFSEGVGEAVESLFEKAVHVMPKRKPK